ncbi:serine hydrolase domain-containing protein [Undibacterium sp. Di26W]|uniref:serine hydrolase domain-containing protein n=1 Tax=Undibacterium sp. Di26W TaxID=3413035 RepID=UPI003BF45C06
MPTVHIFPAILSLLLSSHVAGQTSVPATPEIAVEKTAPITSVNTDNGSGALKDKLQAMFNTACSRDEFSGAYLVAKGNQIISEAACGEASKRYHVANTIDTRFNVASVGKMFTAVGIGQLAEAGRLSYSAPVSKYLDASWLAPAVAKKITVGQLLSHTSGLGDIFNAQFLNGPYIQLATLKDLDGYKIFTRDATPVFEPGSNYFYSNIGMLLLGAIIEKVSGQSYYDYVRQHVFLPAGMNSTDNYVRDEGTENIATGYMDKKDRTAGKKENTFLMLLRGAPYGAGYSTVHDLLRFAQALQMGMLLKPATRNLFWQDHTAGRADKGSYGYGFELGTGTLGKVAGHSGQMPGAYSKLDMYLDKAYTVVVLSNYEPGILPLAERIAMVLESLPEPVSQ